MEKKERKNKKHISKNELFSYQSIFSFLVGVQNFPFLTTWPKKRAPKKHYKNGGFSNPFFGEQFCVTKRPCLDKKSQIQKFQLPFFAFFFSCNNKKHKK